MHYSSEDTMKLTVEQIKAITCGSVDVYETDNGWCCRRMTREMEEAYKIFREDNYKKKAQTCAGVRLAFETDSSSFSFTYGHYTDFSLGMGWFEIFVNGVKAGYYPMDFGRKDLTAKVSLDGRVSLVEVYFPYHKCVAVKDVTVDDGSYIKPVKRSMTMLSFGDSITHGMCAQSPSRVYAVSLADKLEADLYNIAVSGDRFFPEILEYDMGISPDIITVAYGTNDWWVHSRPTVERRSREFIKKLSAKYPASKIFVVSPIDRLSHEKAAKFGDYLICMHELLERSASGLDNVTVVNGWELVPADPAYFADGLHPSDHGMDHYAENLYKKIKKHI